MVEMSDVIAKLAERTAQNRVPWKTSASKETFIAAFGNLSVLISSHSTGLSTVTKLSVLNEEGNEIDHAEFSSNDFGDDKKYSLLRDLYRSAKRCAVGTDQKLEELFARIDSAPPVSTA